MCGWTNGIRMVHDTDNSIVEHVAGADDFEVAVATYWAAVTRWPAARITLRQGIRVVHDTGRRVLSQLGQSSPQTRTGGL